MTKTLQAPEQISRDLTAVSATELAHLIRSGVISAREVVEAQIARIEACEPALNAVVERRFDRARAEADAVDDRRIRGEELGPLAGLPITIKEQFLVEGMATTFGLTSQAGHRAEHDGPLVGRLREAGAVILAKTNVSQLLYYHESDNPLYGRTNNPWNLARTPGGSSGGEAAAVAAGYSVFGLASDMGGSTRVPAHFCGLYGLKPTSDRLTTLDTRPGIFASGQEGVIPQPGVLARHARDLTLAFSILAAPGLERIDPRVPPVPWRDPTEVQVAGLRIALYDNDGFFPASPAVRRAVQVAADALRASGAIVEDWQPPAVPGAMGLLYAIIGSDGGHWGRAALKGNQPDRRIAALSRLARLPRPLRASIGAGLSITRQRRLAGSLSRVGTRSVADYWELVAQRTQYRRHFIAALDAGRYDVILCPPHALPALTHGSGFQLLSAASYSMLYNLLGMPAGIAPVTRVQAAEASDRPRSLDIVERAARAVERDSAGLPVGIQVVARHWREDIVLAILQTLDDTLRTRPDYPRLPRDPLQDQPNANRDQRHPDNRPDHR